MSAGWVAVSVRARAMTSRRLGPGGTARLGALDTLDDAVSRLAGSPYGHDVRPGQGLAEAQRAVVRALLWNVRVLAGWAPREGVALLRAMVAWLEVANTVDHLLALGGATVPAPYELGGLGTAWARIRESSSREELREVLAASSWGDPGADGPRALSLSMQLSAADRLVTVVPQAEDWAAGAVALLLARELVSDRGPLPGSCRQTAARVVGASSVEAGSLGGLVAALPRAAAWALAGVAAGEQLWGAEARWWRRLDHDAHAMVRRSGPGRAVLVGAAGVLAADAWRVRGALELAARGGGGGEDADAVA